MEKGGSKIRRKDLEEYGGVFYLKFAFPIYVFELFWSKIQLFWKQNIKRLRKNLILSVYHFECVWVEGNYTKENVGLAIML